MGQTFTVLLKEALPCSSLLALETTRAVYAFALLHVSCQKRCCACCAWGMAWARSQQLLLVSPPTEQCTRCTTDVKECIQWLLRHGETVPDGKRLWSGFNSACVSLLEKGW